MTIFFIKGDLLMSKNNKEDNRFINFIIKTGQIIYDLFLLQVLWIFYSLKGFIFLGVFPATISIVNIYYKLVEGHKSLSIIQESKEGYDLNFKQANQIGYLYVLIFGLLYIDLRVSIVYIQSIILHTFLLLLTLLTLIVCVYSLIIIVRYDFSFKDILKQAFFVSLSVPIYTIATLIGIILVSSLMYNFIFLFLFFGIPLFLIPVVWFTYTGLKQAEEQRKELNNE